MRSFFALLPVFLLVLVFPAVDDARAADGVTFNGVRGEVRETDLPGPDNLKFVGHTQINPFHVMDVEISGDRAFISSGAPSGLETYDISDPANPTRINHQGPAIWGTRTYGNRLYAFARSEGFQIYDISGSTPVFMGEYNPPGKDILYENGVLVGNILYVAAHQSGIHVFDVTDPGNIASLAGIALSDNACWDVEAYADHLIVANGRFGMSVVDLAGTPSEVAVVELPGLANHVVLDGAVAILSLGPGGIATVDMASPAAPQLLDRAPSSGNAFGSGIWDHKLVVGSWYALEVFDVSDPANIVKTGHENTKTWAMGADVEDIGGEGLVVVGDWRGMSVYLVETDPAPDIEVDPAIVDFGVVDTWETVRVAVKNTGTATLNVNLSSIPAGITAQPQAFSVAPGDARAVRLRASGTGSVFDSIMYNSNDPDEPSFRQNVYKNNTSFPQVDSDAPELVLKDIDGYWHYLSDYKGRVIFLEFGGLW